MWTALIGPISNIAGQWLNNRQEKAVAKQKLAVAKIEAQVKKVEETGDWEQLAMKASDNSWKDELWTICFVLVIFACYTCAAALCSRWLQVLRDDCPEWLSWGILASIGASIWYKVYRAI